MSGEYQSREQRRKAQQKKKTNKKKRKSGVWKKIFISLFIIGIIGMIAGGATLAFYISDAPDLNEDQLKGNLSSKVYDMNKKQVYEIGAEKTTYVPIDEIPDHVKNAFIATEDVRFYEHNGIDIIRFGGAVLANIQEGFGSEGASTITQQLVKLSFLTPEKTIKRKVQEAWLAIQVEQKFSKDQILEMYLNRVYYPGNYYGVARAAEAFFGKSLDDLTIGEAAMIAGMVKNPHGYNPRENLKAAEERRNTVLMLMEKHGFISSAEKEEAKQIPIADSLVKPTEKSNDHYAFIEQVIEEVRDKLDMDPSAAGLKIYTTLDPDAQSYVEDLLNGDSLGFSSEHLQAGVTLLDTESGEIRAIGGGRNQPIGGFNYAVDTKRQPGSTIKPVLDYGPAIEHLKWSTYHQIKDEPYTYSNGAPINNYDNRHKGWMSIRQALVDSRNIPALKAMQEVGLDKAQQFAKGVGIDLKEIEEAYSIGGFGGETVGVSPLEMAGAFSAFGNNGFYIKPHTVKKVELADGTVIDLAPEPEEAMSDYTAFMITDMMKSVVQYGTGTRANVPGLNIAGKTGSTNFNDKDKQKYNIPKGAAKDSWFVGYTPKYTAAVWTGMEKNDEKMYLTTKDQRLAKDIFREIIKHVSKGDRSDFKQPKSVVKVAIEKGSNPAKLASKFTPKDMITYEYFVKGNKPTKVSDKYKKLSKPSNVQVAYNEEAKNVSLTWGYDKKLLDNTSFEVSLSVNGGDYKPVTTTKDMSYTVSNVEPGSLYKFQVVAINDNSRSDPAAAMIEIPKKEEEEKEEIDEEDLEELLPPNPEEGENEDDKKDKDKDKEKENPSNGDDNPNNDNGNQGNGNDNEDSNDDQNNENGDTPADGQPMDDV
ncbi:PBP1A family penicillin-binding protein [Bacillus sp. FJAT-47783]|uniref:PBP1A family penicillin-binding protein n=1 Tax=Bacillus sp. FJAT-47783 TaxID=2922712 RepID=UPI001FADBC8A|nr:PBP1A family penicillin-binding protein [Bacillus sp. FJAT-47783]